MITTAGSWVIAQKDELEHAISMKEKQPQLKKFWQSRIRDIKNTIKSYSNMPENQKIVLGGIETMEEKEIVFGKGA
jgi:hypothetical protein